MFSGDYHLKCKGSRQVWSLMNSEIVFETSAKPQMYSDCFVWSSMDGSFWRTRKYEHGFIRWVELYGFNNYYQLDFRCLHFDNLRKCRNGAVLNMQVLWILKIEVKLMIVQAVILEMQKCQDPVWTKIFVFFKKGLWKWKPVVLKKWQMMKNNWWKNGISMKHEKGIVKKIDLSFARKKGKIPNLRLKTKFG